MGPALERGGFLFGCFAVRQGQSSQTARDNPTQHGDGGWPTQYASRVCRTGCFEAKAKRPRVFQGVVDKAGASQFGPTGILP